MVSTGILSTKCQPSATHEHRFYIIQRIYQENKSNKIARRLNIVFFPSQPTYKMYFYHVPSCSCAILIIVLG